MKVGQSVYYYESYNAKEVYSFRIEIYKGVFKGRENSYLARVRIRSQDYYLPARQLFTNKRALKNKINKIIQNNITFASKIMAKVLKEKEKVKRKLETMG